MKLSYALLQKLKMQYNPDSIIEIRYRGLDLAFRTDHEGNPITLFLGRKLNTGKIKGRRYVRTIQKDAAGNLLKDHWDFKGNT